MLGEIYLASALAIFFAIFEWSERIFGISEKVKNKEKEFCSKTGLNPEKYTELKQLISNPKQENQGEYLKKIMNIIKKVKLKKDDKKIFNKLKENDEKIQEWQYYNKWKKVFFIISFLYLFIAGTILIILEEIPNENIGNLSWVLFIILQALLFINLGFGSFIYFKINNCEKKIQENLNFLINK